MKKLFSWMLIVVMLCAGAPAYAMGADEDIVIVDDQDSMPSDDAEAAAPESDEPIGVQPGSELTIATATELMGYFATDMWGNNTSDMDVRMMLHGYSTIAWQRASVMAVDETAIVNVSIAEATSAGGMSYAFEISPDLVYNDGVKLTARDYAFSLLLSCSPLITEIGGMSMDFGHIAGFSDYHNGEANALKGLRIIDDHKFSVEMLPDYAPYFHSLSRLNITPYPIHVIAPGCEIRDDGEGAYISGDLTAELLRQTLLDPETGYLFNPKVTSGPYQLEGFDPETCTATFTANPLYIGNYEGQKPHIERIIYTASRSADMAKQIEEGEVDIVHKVIDQLAYEELDALVESDTIKRPYSYLRSGFGYLSFACEQSPTSSLAVRNAIASAIDKEAFVKATFREEMALPIYGYYGLGQWMVSGTVDVDGAQVPVIDALKAQNPPYSLEEAKALLIADGWSLNEQGELFMEGSDVMRYRQSENGFEPLLIKWARIRDNRTADAIQSTIEAPFAALGIGLEITEMSLSEVMAQYYRHSERTYNMFNLGSNFNYVFDPYFDFHVDDKYQGRLNTTGLRDEQLMQLAWELRRTEAWDSDGFLERWLAFQERWIEEMPMVPLYSNVYFDFVANGIEGYNIENFTSLAQALNYVYLVDEDAV